MTGVFYDFDRFSAVFLFHCYVSMISISFLFLKLIRIFQYLFNLKFNRKTQAPKPRSCQKLEKSKCSILLLLKFQQEKLSCVSTV